MAGRKAMPVNLLLVNGNKNRIPKAEIDARRKAEERIKPKADKVKAPKQLSASTKRIFNRLAQELQATELITNVDVEPLALYCWAYTQWETLSQGHPAFDEIGDPKVDANGNQIIEYDYKNIDILFKQIKSMGAEFGFTPASRAKLAMPSDDKPKLTAEQQMFGDV